MDISAPVESSSRSEPDHGQLRWINEADLREEVPVNALDTVLIMFIIGLVID